MEKIKTVKDVEVEIQRALIILKALPKEGPRPMHSGWPQIWMAENAKKGDSREAYFYRPLPSEIDDMDLVLEDWLRVLNFDDRMLVLKRTSGSSWKSLAYSYNKSRSWLSYRYNASLKAIYNYVLRRQAEEACK